MKKTKVLMSILCLMILFSCVASIIPNKVYAAWYDKTGGSLDDQTVGTLWIYIWNYTNVDTGDCTELAAYILEPTGSTSDAYTYTFKLSDMPRYDATKYNLLVDYYNTFEGLKGVTGYGYTSFVQNDDIYEVTASKTDSPLIAFHCEASEVTVTFNTNGGSAVENQTVTSGGKATQPSTSRTGYTLEGWYNGDTKFDFNTEVSSDLTLTAHWTPTNYTIGYTLNGGSATNPTSYTIETNTITLNNPTRNGYEFKGWSGTGLTGDINKSVSIAKGSTGNRSYTANWTPINYTIGYTLNGGNATNPTSYTIETNTITLNNPTRDGYTFKGWSGTGLTGDENTSVSIAKGSTGNKEFTANWYKNVPDADITVDVEVIYTGSELEPTITVKDSDGLTIDSNEYTVTYNNNTNAGTASLTITDNAGGSYLITEKTIEFEIEKQEVTLEVGNTETAYIEVLGLPIVYNSDHHEVSVNVYDNNGRLIPPTEYTVSYSNNRDAGTATVIITNVDGGNYIVNGSENFEIKKLVTDVEITLVDTSNCIYNGESHTPAIVKVKAGNSTLDSDEYFAAYYNNIDAGTATVKVESENPSIEYNGEITFTIQPKDVEVTLDNQTKVYGDEDSELTYQTEGLVGEDELEGLTVSRTSGENVGEYAITATHDDKKDANYTVTISGEGILEITPQEVTISGDSSEEVPSIILSETSFVYDGKQKEPIVTVKDNNGNVIPDEEYEIEFANNKKAGTATVTIIDKENGNYIINGSTEFEIEPRTLDVEITLSGDSEYEYTGEEIKPEVIKVMAGTNEIVASEYEVVYEENISVGTATVTLKSKDNHPNVIFNGSTTFTIIKKQVTVTPDSGEKIYGDEDPEFTYTTDREATLQNITLSRASGEDVGTYTITATCGTEDNTDYDITFETAIFTITQKTLTAEEVTIAPESEEYTYSGEAIESKVVLKDENGNVIPKSEYEVTYENNIEAGTGTIKVTNKDGGNYVVPEMETTFTIVPKELTAEELTIVPESDEYTYTGEAIEPNIVLKDADGNVIPESEYEVTYENNTEAGTGTIKVTNKDGGNYVVPEMETAFTIVPKELTAEELTIVPESEEYTYSGEAIEPNIVLKDADGNVIPESEYEVTYENNTEAGTGTIKVTNKDGGNYVVPEMETTFTIVPKELTAEETTVSPEKTRYAYTGKAIEPKVVLKDADGNVIPESEYEVTYENNTKAGTGTIKITNKDGGNVVVPEMETTFTIYRQSSGGGSSSGSSSSKKDDKKEENKDENKTAEETIWENASELAIPELKEAKDKGLIPETFAKKDFTKAITRKDFAAVAVKLYEAITKTKVEPVKVNPFIDTNDEYVLKAYAVGITVGTSETTFTPDALITREQMATMLTRGLNKAGININVDLNDVDRFVDDYEMHDWGKEAVYFMSGNDIIKGVGDNRFNTLGNATFEQSLAIVLRSVKIFAK